MDPPKLSWVLPVLPASLLPAPLGAARPRGAVGLRLGGSQPVVGDRWLNTAAAGAHTPLCPRRCPTRPPRPRSRCRAHTHSLTCAHQRAPSGRRASDPPLRLRRRPGWTLAGWVLNVSPGQLPGRSHGPAVGRLGLGEGGPDPSEVLGAPEGRVRCGSDALASRVPVPRVVSFPPRHVSPQDKNSCPSRPGGGDVAGGI